jgi:hypothetical protein
MSFIIGTNYVQHILLGNINARFWLCIPFLFLVVFDTGADNGPFFLYSFTLLSWFLGGLVVISHSDERTTWITDMRFLGGLLICETIMLALCIVNFWAITHAWAALNLVIITVTALIDCLGTSGLIAVLRINPTKEFLEHFSGFRIACILVKPSTAWYKVETTTVIFTMPLKYVDPAIRHDTSNGDFTDAISEIQRSKAIPLQSDLL